MGIKNQPSEGARSKGTVLPAALAFLGVMGYGPVAGQINAGVETEARTKAEQKISQTRDQLHSALGHFSLRNNPGVNRAECETIQTLILDGKNCEVAVDGNGFYFIFVEGEDQPYFLGEGEKAARVISTLKNIFGPRQETKTILAANDR
ncbi:hypothetical protein JW752_04360 [Candidatus Peregrinibacteria bacterium]|nr:hypothetical protein [Candidatus Peregrinibacteria bacterium]